MGDESKIEIRMVQRKDTQVLMDFINTLSVERTYIMAQGRQWSFEEEDKYVEDFIKGIEAGNAVKLLAFSGSTLVGVADAIRSHYDTETHICTFGLTVAREWRGRGIGSALMDKTLELVSMQMPDITIVRLGVFANNPVAERMYAKRGFVRYGTLPGGLLHKGEKVDHILMYKSIQSKSNN